MADSFDVLDRVTAVARRATWQRRAEGVLAGLWLGAAGGAVAVLWRALVDPGFAWWPVAVAALAAGLLPFLAYGSRTRVSPLAAAWLLDRRLGAGGRIATLFEVRGRPGRGSRFEPCLERETAALLATPWTPSWRRVTRRLAGLAGVAAAAALMLLLAPAPAPSSAPPPPSPAEEALRFREAARRLAAALSAAGQPGLAEDLARTAGGECPDPEEAERAARALEDRLRVQGLIVTIRRALGDTPAGRELRTRLLGESGDGVATTSTTDEKIERLERALALPGLPDALREQLDRVLAATRSGDETELEAAVSAVRETLGSGVPAGVLAESAELLGILSARARGGAGETRSGSEPGPSPEKPGTGIDPAVRGDAEKAPVFDPNLRRVIRRYFGRE